jgi:DNA mismatch endonuclease (patch repair protein)
MKQIWNKGLTKETDERIAKYGRSVSLSKKGKTKYDTPYIQHHSDVMKSKTGSKNSFYGHKHTEETKNIIRNKARVISTKRWKDPVYRKTCIDKLKNIVKKNTKIEIKVQTFLTDNNIKFQKDVNLLDRTIPDQFIGTKKLVIYEDGCRWHGCSKCKDGRFYDIKKRKSDNTINRFLKNNGYTVLRFWEHDIEKHFNNVTNKILRTIELL